ncbi:hypothetical protein BS47DRAFT_1354627 [Hydnum rufescens UP504]|uniref:Uncharacterized protein n=1 Tax=Hydnum rufescens UP504 TaxID=1448309 RepID=A0A9P6AGI3_9AGAM|nr:hypothetical protein BS47DRAFT_1354627 [Hydnum rufescens UP504]
MLSAFCMSPGPGIESSVAIVNGNEARIAEWDSSTVHLVKSAGGAGCSVPRSGALA